MLPETRTAIIDGQKETMLNASAAIELLRNAPSPEARQIMLHYHVAEAEIAATQPWLSEERIRSDALLRALASAGVNAVEGQEG